MKFTIFATAALAWVCAFPSAHAAPSALDLAGRWKATVEFGKMKIKLVFRVVPDNGRAKAALDIPDQGMKGLEIPSLLYNHPEVRLELDSIGTSFNGRLSDDGKSIAGAFEEGPGGNPVGVTFHRDETPEAPEPARNYTLAAGEKPDMRGYWQGALEIAPAMTLRFGLRIGLQPDGAYHVCLDSVDQGLRDAPASRVSYADGAAKAEWDLFQAVFDAKLSEDGNALAGTWKQGARTFPVAFKRRSDPFTGMPEGISFVPDKNVADDVRGEWKGTLDTGGAKLRLVMKIGKLPDATFAGSMVSLDQAGSELPFSSVDFTNQTLRAEVKPIRGVFTGKLNAAGTEFDGVWDQMGNPLPLKMQRVPAAKP